MNIIEKWLADNERTPAWLARKAGMTRQSIDNHLKGRSEPQLDSVRKLAAATGLSVEAIVAWEVEPDPTPDEAA